MKHPVLIAISLTIVCGCGTKSPLTDDLDRSTPEATFKVSQQGVEKKLFKQMILSCSEQQKRFLLFETFFTAGFVDEKTKQQFDELCRKNSVNYEKLVKRSENPQHLFELIEARIRYPEQFLIEANRLFFSKKSKPRIAPDILKVTIEGDRATVLHKIFIYSYTDDNKGNTVEEVDDYERLMYMRKYGKQWLVCPKEEWEDPRFIWKVPK